MNGKNETKCLEKERSGGIMQSSKELWVGQVERERRNEGKEREDKVRKEDG